MNIPDLINSGALFACEPSASAAEINALHRERMAEVIAELAQYRAAVQTLAEQDFGAGGWNEQCNQAAVVLRNLLNKHD